MYWFTESTRVLTPKVPHLDVHRSPSPADHPESSHVSSSSLLLNYYRIKKDENQGGGGMSRLNYLPPLVHGLYLLTLLTPHKTKSSTTCPTLCPIIPIKSTHFLGCLYEVRYWGRDSCWSELLQSTVLSYFQVQTTSLIPFTRTSGRLQ